MSEGELLTLAEHVAETLDVGPGTRVYEVDCGDGALLFPFHQNGFIVGGCDADPEAIKVAIAAMPDGVFQIGAASALDPAVPWHVVICRSFAGAPDPDYMRGVLARMFAKATHGIAVLDLPDEQRRWMLHALTEIGARAIQFDNAAGVSNNPRVNVFARV